MGNLNLKTSDTPEKPMETSGCLTLIFCLCLAPFVWYYMTMYNAYVFADIWNWFMPVLFGVKAITMWHAAAIGSLSGFITSGLAVLHVSTQQEFNKIKKALNIPDEQLLTGWDVLGHFVKLWGIGLMVITFMWFFAYVVNVFFFTKGG